MAALRRAKDDLQRADRDFGGHRAKAVEHTEEAIREVEEAMKCHRQGKTCVIPVILSPVSWQGTPFGELQALPRSGVPITDRQWRGQVNALYSVAQGLEQVLKERGTVENRLAENDPVGVASL